MPHVREGLNIREARPRNQLVGAPGEPKDAAVDQVLRVVPEQKLLALRRLQGTAGRKAKTLVPNVPRPTPHTPWHRIRR